MKLFLVVQFLLLASSVFSVEFAPGVFLIHDVLPSYEHDRCTTIIAGKLATDELFTVVTYTADCAECDNRVVKIPAMDHEPGTKKKIIDSLQGEYPRYVGSDRGKWYKPTEGASKETAARNWVAEVNHTYAYFDSVYGVMNEHGLGIGESSCYSRIAVGPNSSAIWEIGELSRVALERCKTARCAIQLMGKLAEEGGFYGDIGEYGEALTLIDQEEAWVFEISGTPKADGAVWVAQRVPDDHIAVVANSFTIHEVDTKSDDFMYSSNLFSLAKELGFYKPHEGEVFNFAKHYSPKNEKPTYSDRRVWRVFDSAAPSLKLNAHLIDDNSYPFSVKVDQKLPVEFFMKMNRDFYEGTEFDMTKELAAGPWATPFRQEFPAKEGYPSFERAISIHRTSYSLVVQSRHNVDPLVGSVAWFAPDAPHTSCYFPLYAGAQDVAEPYAVGSLKSFSHNAWWAFDFLSNWANLKFSYMIQDIKQIQNKMESKFLQDDKMNREKFLEFQKAKNTTGGIAYLTNYVLKGGEKLVSDWWTFAESMIVKYNDGYINDEKKIGQTTPFPENWMNLYTEDQNSPFGIEQEIEFLKEQAKNSSCHPDDIAKKSASGPSNMTGFFHLFLAALVGAACSSCLFGVYVYRRAKYSNYVPIL